MHVDRRIFLLAALSGAILGCEDQPQWYPVSPAEGRFSVLMPTKPRLALQTANTEWGPLEVRFFEVETDDGAVVYSVTYTDYPFQDIDAEKADALLLEAQAKTVKELSGKILSESKTAYQTLPARRTSIRAASGVEYAVLVVLAKARLYQVFTASRPGVLPPEIAKKFFDSFQIDT
jgi:hypothetical protein